MTMGSAYAGGAGIVKRPGSYGPLINSSIDRSRLLAESYKTDREMALADREMDLSGRRMDLDERKWDERDQSGLDRRSRGGRGSSSADNYARADQKRQRQIEDDKQMYESYNAGSKGSTPAPIQQPGGLQTPNQYEGEDLKIQKWRERQGQMERAEEEGTRKQEKHGMEMRAGGIGLEQAEQAQDHAEMMRAAFLGNYKAVEDYLKKYNASGERGSLDNLMIEDAGNGMVKIKHPNEVEPKLIPVKALITLMAKLGGEQKQGKDMPKKDIAKAAADYAAGGSGGDPDLYQELYEEKFNELSSEGGQRGDKTVVRKERNRASGQVRITYSDGTTEIQ